MSLTENGGAMYMPVAPAYGNGGFGNGFGFGGDGAWLILFILLACGGGWGGFGGMGGFGGGLGIDFPWILQGQQNTDNNVSNGFRDVMLNDGVTSIRDGIHDVQTQLCNSTGNVQMALANGFAGVEQGANTRQMANMQTAFDISSQLANCCCENRLATAQTQALVQSENCADRQALSDGLRDIIANQTAGFQRVLDQMCNDKIDAKNEKIADLQNQLAMAEIKANNNQQTQTLITDNLAQTNALERYLAPTPIPAYVVQNPNCCGQTYGCGCGQ